MLRVGLLAFLFGFLPTSTLMAVEIKPNPKCTVPALADGDIIYLGGYSYYTVRDAQAAVYKIARMGYATVKDFQRAVGLKDDGIVGPDTRLKAGEEYNKRFNTESTISGTAPSLLMTASCELENEAPILRIYIKNTGGKPIRIIGGLYCDERTGFTFGDASVLIIESIDTRERGIIAFWQRIHAAKVPCGTNIRPGQNYSMEVTLPKLKENEDGAIDLQFVCLDRRLRDIFVSTARSLKYPKIQNIIK